MLERDAQAAIIAWRDVAARDAHPRAAALAWLFHPPNGEARAKATAGRLRGLGVVRGIPDLLLPARSADGAAVGWACELKRPGGRVAPEQRAALAFLEAEGWRAIVAHDWTAAARDLCRHLGLPERLAP